MKLERERQSLSDGLFLSDCLLSDVVATVRQTLKDWTTSDEQVREITKRNRWMFFVVSEESSREICVIVESLVLQERPLVNVHMLFETRMTRKTDVATMLQSILDIRDGILSQLNPTQTAPKQRVK